MLRLTQHQLTECCPTMGYMCEQLQLAVSPHSVHPICLTVQAGMTYLWRGAER